MAQHPSDLADCTAAALVDLYRTGQASPTQACEAVLARIAERDGRINAFVCVDPEGARAAATASTQRWTSGSALSPLDGVPVSIKDLILTQELPTLRGSHTLDIDQAWDVDGPATARLREAGAVILGKTTTPEFGRAYSALQIQQRNLRRGALGSHMRQFMQRYDLIATPSTAVPAFDAMPAGHAPMTPESMLGWTPFSYPFNLTQQPAITVPCGFTQSGLPIGLQLVGPMFRDAMVLRAARAFEANGNIPTVAPTTAAT